MKMWVTRCYRMETNTR